jgi:hypothetical protein
MPLITRLLIAALVLVPGSSSSAQPSAAGRTQLRPVVVDQTDGGIPAASVTVTPLRGEPVIFVSDERGVAASPALPTGPLTVRVEFPGFLPLTDAAINHAPPGIPPNVVPGFTRARSRPLEQVGWRP